MRSSTSTPKWLHVSKFVALIIFVLTPIIAGISAGMLWSNTLFWLWIGVGVACLGWFITAVIIANKLENNRELAPAVSIARNQVSRVAQ